MTNKPQKQIASSNTSKVLTKTPTTEKIRSAFLQINRLRDDPEILFSDKNKTIQKLRKKQLTKKEESDFLKQALLTLGFENDHALMYTVDSRYRSLSIELRRQLIKDFDCRTHAEKVLVDAVVLGYMRTLRNTEAYSAGLESEGGLWSDKTNYLGMLSKELDRSNRHLLAAYQTLVQLKRPQMNVSVKASQAFVAQAQQFKVETPPHVN